MTDNFIYHPRYIITAISMEGYENSYEVDVFPSDNVSLIEHRDKAMMHWGRVVANVGVSHIHAFLYVQAHFKYNRGEMHLLASV